MTPLTTFLHPSLSALAFFQGTQLSLFERFLTQAVSGIDSTSITAGMQNVAYVVLLVGFLWQTYQAALHGGDVRGLGTTLIKYVATAIVVMNYGSVFTTVNQGFVNAGNWVSNASGAGNLFDNWSSDLQTQFNQVGFQQLWGLVTGSIAGLIDGLLIVVAYILYPVVIVIFGFFYIFYGSVLYIFGPLVIALLPLHAGSRLAKSYIENVFVWNSWPILYGGFGALLSAVQMGQVGQMLNQNNFLGGLGNIEGSFLIGLASIIYSLAIAVIPFIAKRIVSGDVGATAAAMMGAAATALTAGVAAVEGAAAGAAAAGTAGSSTGATGATVPASTSASATSSAAGTSTTANRPAAPQRAATSPSNQSSSSINGRNSTSSPQSGSAAGQRAPGADTPTADSGSRTPEPTTLGEAHAEQIRSDFSRLGAAGARTSIGTPAATTSTSSSGTRPSGGARGGRSSGGNRWSSGSTAALGRRNGIATWGAYHAARLATHGAVSSGRVVAGAGGSVMEAIKDPVGTSARVGGAAGRAAGNISNTASSTARQAQSVAHAATHPIETVRKGVQAAQDTIGGAAQRTASTLRDSVDAVRTGFSSSYEQTRRDNDRDES